MNCYICDARERETPAVAVCHHCGVALCRHHLDEDLLAPRPEGLVRRECLHDPLHSAKQRRRPRRPVSLPWDELEAEAERQGGSAADVFFDRAGLPESWLAADCESSPAENAGQADPVICTRRPTIRALWHAIVEHHEELCDIWGRPTISRRRPDDTPGGWA